MSISLAFVGCEPAEFSLDLPTTNTSAPPPTGSSEPTTPSIEDADGDGVSAALDCDDNDASVFPGAEERCDGLDNDCNGASDEPFDEDGDGWGWCAGDCNDTEPLIYPGAVESCDDLDNDCDGDLDEDHDQDGDGWATCRGDCDDNEATVHLWAFELCDGLDNDCDGLVDNASDLDRDGYGACDADPDCDDLNPDVFPGAPEVCDGLDNDCDGLVPADEQDADSDGVSICEGDCDDADPLRAPTLHDDCDGIDNDCNPLTDEVLDGDLDGLSACDGDCDDLEPLSYPGASEICDGVDNSCDGVVDPNPVCGSCSSWPWDGTNYLICTQSRTWTAARDDCRSMGYELYTITDAAEEIAVSVEWNLTVGGSGWSGYNDLDNEGVWRWASGEPTTYEDWGSGEPNNSGNEDCSEFDWSGLAWNDANCSNSRAYVCEN